MKSIATFAAAFALALLPVAMPAQNSQESTPPPPQQFYRLHFAVEELDAAGKVTNTRTYEETVATGNGPEQQIKTGSRVPIATGSYASSGTPANLANTQFQYVDLGVDLAIFHPEEHGNSLSFRLRADITSIARQTEIAGIGEPVIRENNWDSTLTVPVDKPTVVYSSDDLDSKGKMQVEVTATKVD